MNESLKQEIINHIFNKFGLLTREDVESSKREGPVSNQFLLDQKLTFEVDGEKYDNSIWSGETKVDDGSRVQFIIADLTEEVPEYSLLLQLDSFPPYAARISLDPDDSGSLFFGIDGKWHEASTLFQAKILVAVESLMELYVTWSKNTDGEAIYKSLIDFLKFESESDE